MDSLTQAALGAAVAEATIPGKKINQGRREVLNFTPTGDGETD